MYQSCIQPISLSLLMYISNTILCPKLWYADMCAYNARPLLSMPPTPPSTTRVRGRVTAQYIQK